MASESLSERRAKTAKGRQVALAVYAHRAVDDPVILARAARIVRAALARKKITLDDLEPLPEPEPRRRAKAS